MMYSSHFNTKLWKLHLQHTVYEVPLFPSANASVSNCQGVRKRKFERGSTSGLSHGGARHNIHPRWTAGWVLITMEHILSSHALSLDEERKGREKVSKEERDREGEWASQSITCLCLSLDGWMMDDCIFSNNTKTIPVWGAFFTGAR